MMFGWRKRAKKETSEGSSIIGTRTIERRSGRFSGTLFVEHRRISQKHVATSRPQRNTTSKTRASKYCDERFVGILVEARRIFAESRRVSKALVRRAS